MLNLRCACSAAGANRRSEFRRLRPGFWNTQGRSARKDTCLGLLDISTLYGGTEYSMLMLISTLYIVQYMDMISTPCTP